MIGVKQTDDKKQVFSAIFTVKSCNGLPEALLLLPYFTADATSAHAVVHFFVITHLDLKIYELGPAQIITYVFKDHQNGRKPQNACFQPFC